MRGCVRVVRTTRGNCGFRRNFYTTSSEVECRTRFGTTFRATWGYLKYTCLGASFFRLGGKTRFGTQVLSSFTTNGCRTSARSATFAIYTGFGWRLRRASRDFFSGLSGLCASGNFL